jgi:hypothetical protein
MTHAHQAVQDRAKTANDAVQNAALRAAGENNSCAPIHPSIHSSQTTDAVHLGFVCLVASQDVRRLPVCIC